MNTKKSDLQLHKEYLLDLSEQSRPGELNQFDVLQLDLCQWLQKEQGLSLEQAEAVLKRSPERKEIA